MSLPGDNGEETSGQAHQLIELHTIDQLEELTTNQHVHFRARLHGTRSISAFLTFVILRWDETTVQGVLHDDETSESMMKWVQKIPLESLVQVGGIISNPLEPVQSTSIHTFEIKVDSLYLLQRATGVPFPVAREDSEPMHKRLENRVMDLRHPSNHAIFKIRSRFLNSFRKSMEKHHFLEIQTPKLQAAATESGAQVFKVDYFGRDAFLAQSPQLAKQMAISADFDRVYEIGPVFRAEDSNTHRHLTEYTGLDLEMMIKQEYHEIVDIVLDTLRSGLEAISAMRHEIQVVRQLWPGDDLEISDSIPVISFEQGIQMLRDAGEPDIPVEDLSTPHEIKLGELVKGKYHTDLFVLDKFPTSARPFYTHLDPSNPSKTNSFDIFLRGQEICTGGQRISDPSQLRKAMSKAGIDERSMKEYLHAFDWGIAPHAGVGLGLERIIFLALNLGDVRYASLFPRDPKSLPEPEMLLTHPDASTRLSYSPSHLPVIEDLIANYGDATNTSWLDDKFLVWRHETNGAAVGYSARKKMVIMAGDPLCEKDQYESVINNFLEFLSKHINLSPAWLLVSDQVQEILSTKHGWRSLACTEEQRLDENQRHTHADDQRDRKHEARRLDRQGVSIHSFDPTDDEDCISRINNRIREWQDARASGAKQVHLTDIAPWQDQKHRRYFLAESTDQRRPEALVVLTQLSRTHGWQVKWALDFPNAPHGAIDALIHLALSTVAGQPVTFGAGVSDHLIPVHHIHGLRSKILSKTYKAIVSALKLRGKAQFREKFGTIGETLYICYPKHAITPFNVDEIVEFFEE
ncbi:hypothetical protein BD324DRAFT_579856 [Kockovaella imperatae]|uniref:Probable aspartate--tRNA ligase, cytoplasmic n=1 Tax=Kockovaella imperatae TaxID=4999 RepID=A0A1Y1UG95_9TREE|nr:hypothetical protein BD324DRAFT_579856 [Kockovaella imperatae]ORX37091.1 hypothetical protein BD324DRAFT_579856 [Kockovaella imperatae]